jgi:hypothetical protein
MKDYYYSQLNKALIIGDDSPYYPKIKILGSEIQTCCLDLNNECIDEVIKALKALKKSKAQKLREKGK